MADDKPKETATERFRRTTREIGEDARVRRERAKETGFSEIGKSIKNYVNDPARPDDYTGRLKYDTSKAIEGAKDKVVQSGAMLYKGVTAPLMGTHDEVGGVLNMMGQGGPTSQLGLFGPMIEAIMGGEEGFAKKGGDFNRGVYKTEALDRMAEDELGPLLSLGSEMVGASNKLAPAMKFGEKVLRNTEDVGDFWGLLKRMGQQAGIGGAEAGFESVMEGETSPLGIAFTMGLGGVMGSGAQGVFGELAPRVAKAFSVNKASANSKVGIGVGGEGMNPNVGAEMSAAGREMLDDPNASILNTQLGDATLAETTGRLADTVAQTKFPTNYVGMKGLNEDTMDAYVKSMKAVTDIITDTSTRVSNRIADTIGAPKSAYSNSRGDIKNRRVLGKVFDSLESIEEGSLGAGTVQYSNVRDSLTSGMAKATGKTRNGVAVEGQLSPAAADVQNFALDAIRPTVKSAHTGKQVRPPSGIEQGEINLETANLSLAQVYEARKALAAKYNIANLSKDPNMTTEHLIAANAALRVMDNNLADRIPANTREAYRKSKRIEDSWTEGGLFYNSNSYSDKTSGRSLEEDLAKLKKHPEEYKSFIDGYKSALSEDIRTNGFTVAMNRFVGKNKVGEDGLDVFDVKQQGIDDLSLILGPKEAEKFLSETASDAELLSQQGRLQEMLKLQGYSSEAIEDIVRDGDDILLAAGLGPASQSMFANATMGAAGRQLKAMGAKEAKVLMANLGAKGKEAGSAMLDMAAARLAPVTAPVGGAIGGHTAAEMTDDLDPSARNAGKLALIAAKHAAKQHPAAKITGGLLDVASDLAKHRQSKSGKPEGITGTSDLDK